MRLILLIFTLFIFSSSNHAQNLVPNPSFEDCFDYPSKYGEIELVSGWFADHSRSKPNTPDYFHKKAKMPKTYSDFVGVPKNSVGYQEPKTGDAYAGIIIWKDTEVLGCELQKELKKDRFYKVELFVSLQESWNYAIDNIGCYFSETKIKIFNKEPYSKKHKEQKYNFTPQIVSPKGEPITDKENWTKISGTFKAKGGEKYMYLGCFAPLSDMTVKRIGKRTYKASYYYIDDVSVYELDSLGNPVMEEIRQDTLVNIKDTLITQIENTEPGESIILKNIQFEFNKSELLPGSFETLNKLSAYLKSTPSVKIEISGHTDSIGSEARNLELSLQRAKSVNDYLINSGIEQEKIIYKGYGSSHPTADNKTENGRELNRRVELKIIEK